MKNTLILKNVNIFDGIHSELIMGKNILISDGRIRKISSDDIQLTDVTTYDLTNCYVLPGFIDCHMHMVLEEVVDKETSLTISSPGGERYPNADAAVAYLGARNSKRMLQAGFTTVLDGGGSNFIECALREAINKGYVEGPDYYVSGKQITTNKAHFVGFSIEPYGPYKMRKAVRDLVWWGVDQIKLQLSPPIRLVGRNSDVCDFTYEEVEAAIDEAHNYSTPVHAHLRGPKPIKHFLKAGGDVVVHGTGMDDEGIEMMLKTGTYLLPTLQSPTPNPSPELIESKNEAVLELLKKTSAIHWESAKRAYMAGVKIAFSTDSGCLGIHVGENANEFLNLEAIGMSRFEALKTATSEAAKVIGQPHEIGKVLTGYKAKLVVLSGNPLEDLRETKNVRLTIKNGKIVYDRSLA